jgi:Riboflavin kinase
MSCSLVSGRSDRGRQASLRQVGNFVMLPSVESNTIRRKPLPVHTHFDLGQTSAEASPAPIVASPNPNSSGLFESPSSATAREGGSYDPSIFDYYADSGSRQLAQLSLEDRSASLPAPPPGDALDDLPAPVPIQPLREVDTNVNSASSKSSKSLPLAAGQAIRSAYGEVRHFAGGLISHPSESTKHYSILRHSHGLVYYSGSYTNFAITVFADRELPPDRSFWLQRKGFSGKTGMRAGVLFGAHGAWIDVTPSVTASSDQLKPADERAWQRDISKFLRKSPKKLAQHRARETNILRIPCEAYDGYLRVVMCSGENGKKYLCPSPVFRLASTSMSSSSVRGASLSTLPIEAAIKVGTFAAQRTANNFVGPYVETARSLVTSQVTSVYQPSAIVKTAATAAYDTSGIPNRIDNMNEQYDDAREASHRIVEGDHHEPLPQPLVIGDESGPQQPYPVRFNGKVVKGTGRSMTTMGIPTANVVNADSDVLVRHSGIHIGWASINLPKKLQDQLLVDDDWHEAVISIIPNPDTRANVVQKKMVKVYILEDFEGAKFFDAKISLIMMEHIRPAPPTFPGQEPDLQTAIADLNQDVASTTASLARPAWKVDETLERIRSSASSRSLNERYVDARQSTQKQIDGVPAWRLGMRTDGIALKDRFIGNGGVTVSR